jgi:VWFA-related protein
VRRLAAILSIGLFALPLTARQAPENPQAPTLREPQGRLEQSREATQAQQRPVFRGGTHFVRVDAYPSRNGKIIEGLTRDDFEILEDGKPQQIESFDFVKFESFTPEAERRDPSSQRESFDKAADPRYRLFVVYVDMALSRSSGPIVSNDNVPHMRQPLANFFERVAGPSDLFALLTTRNSAKDLVLAQRTSVTVEQVMDLWRANVIDRDEADEVIGFCGGTEAELEALKLRFRADATYTNLRDLVGQLGSLRQERKNVVLVTNLLPRWRPDRALLDQIVNARRGAMPTAGATRGRITNDDREVVTNTRGGNANACAGEAQRLLLMDFDPRYYELLREAKRENVTFYVITPGGLQAPTTAPGIDAVKRATDDLISLANETDGVAVTGTNDLNAGFKRIADDLAAYYVLGYYTTNTNFDGGVRTLKVRYKGNGQEMRARRQYRAPTREEIAALTASASAAARRAAGPTPIDTALTVLERGTRPFAVYAAMAPAQMTVVAELSAASIQAGRWKEGADVEVETVTADGNPIARARGRIEAGAYAAAIPVPVAASAPPARVTVKVIGAGAPPADDWAKLAAARTTLVGEPLAYRSSSRSPRRPVAVFDFARNERIRVEWPVLAALDRRDVRLLDRSGKPLPVELPLAEDTEKKQLVLDMALSGLGRGDYLIELTAGAGAATERGLLAVRIRP